VEDNEVEIIEAEDRPEETPEVGLKAKNFVGFRENFATKILCGLKGKLSSKVC
jgi:hypothetical protein